MIREEKSIRRILSFYIDAYLSLDEALYKDLQALPKTYIVGGFVRDRLVEVLTVYRQENTRLKPTLLKLKQKLAELKKDNFSFASYDFDLATALAEEKLLSALETTSFSYQKSRFFSYNLFHPSFGTARAKLTGLRRELFYAETHCPHIRHTGSLKIDSFRRDFTCNAVYYSPRSRRIYDYHQAVIDMTEGRLKMIGQAELRLQEDNIRFLRALILAYKFSFNPDDELSASMQFLKFESDFLKFPWFHQNIWVKLLQEKNFWQASFFASSDGDFVSSVNQMIGDQIAETAEIDVSDINEAETDILHIGKSKTNVQKPAAEDFNVRVRSLNDQLFYWLFTYFDISPHLWRKSLIGFTDILDNDFLTALFKEKDFRPDFVSYLCLYLLAALLSLYFSSAKQQLLSAYQMPPFDILSSDFNCMIASLLEKSALPLKKRKSLLKIINKIYNDLAQFFIAYPLDGISNNCGKLWKFLPCRYRNNDLYLVKVFIGENFYFTNEKEEYKEFLGKFIFYLQFLDTYLKKDVYDRRLVHKENKDGIMELEDFALLKLEMGEKLKFENKLAEVEFIKDGGLKKRNFLFLLKKICRSITLVTDEKIEGNFGLSVSISRKNYCKKRYLKTCFKSDKIRNSKNFETAFSLLLYLLQKKFNI